MGLEMDEIPGLNSKGDGSINPPVVRMVGPGGFAVYPRMEPDGLGGWQVSNPEEICRLLGYPKPHEIQDIDNPTDGATPV